MKKYIALLCAALIFVGLAGCGTAPTAEDLSVHYFDFNNTFQKKMEKESNHYEITEQMVSTINDEGDTLKPYAIKQTQLGRSYDLEVILNADREVKVINLIGEATGTTDKDFALLAKLVYESLGLPKVKRFYDQFNLMTEEPFGFLETAPNWFVTVSSSSDGLFLTIYRK